MLNVLIAVVSDSYDGAMAKSRRIYHRARLESIAEIDALITALKQIKYIKNIIVFVGGTLLLYGTLCSIGIAMPLVAYAAFVIFIVFVWICLVYPLIFLQGYLPECMKTDRIENCYNSVGVFLVDIVFFFPIKGLSYFLEMIHEWLKLGQISSLSEIADAAEQPWQGRAKQT